MVYTLVAETLLPSGYTHTETRLIDTDNDLDATFEAIFYTLEMAADRPGSPWHVGKVTLTNPAGVVLNERPAKTPEPEQA